MSVTQVLAERRRRTMMAIGGKILWMLERFIARTSLIGDRPFFDAGIFPWVEPLEDNWRVIRSELEAVLASEVKIPNFQQISPDQIRLTSDDRWKTFFLYGMGYKSQRNCERCPETTRLIETVPGMKTAFFSILMPGKHIRPHRGLYKGFLRYHLGLIVPEPKEKCRIRVDDQIAHWEEGKSLIFDDTYEHEVWNDTDGVRVVLFMDVVRPLRFPGSVANDLILEIVRRTPYVQDAKRNQDEWEKNFDPAMLS